MSVITKSIFEVAARWLAASLIGLCCWIGRDTVLQLRQIQSDLVGIKLKLATIEANAMTPETVKQLIQLELIHNSENRSKGK